MKRNPLAIVSGTQTILRKERLSDGLKTTISRVMPSGMEVYWGIKMPNIAKKKDLKPSLEELSRMGLSQKAMALFADMSPSYASKLLKK